MSGTRIAADAFGNALGQGFVDSMQPGLNALDLEDAELGQAMRANAELLRQRATPPVAAAPISDRTFGDIAKLMPELNDPANPQLQYARNADREVDVMSAFKDLTEDRRTGKPSFAYTSWAGSEAEQALFGSTLFDETQRNGSRRSFYVNENGVAFGNPNLGAAVGDPEAHSRANARFERIAAGFEEFASEKAGFAGYLAAQFMPRSVEGWLGVAVGGPVLGEAAGVGLPALVRAAPVLGREVGSFFGRPPQGLTQAQFESMSSAVRGKAAEMGLGDDIFVHGSRAARAARPDSDIDIAIRLASDDFEAFLNTQSRLAAPSAGSAKEATRAYAIENGIIQRGEARLSPLGRELERALGFPVDLSVIRAGGRFDVGPSIPLVKQPRT
jgi:hypothetical protein